MQFRTGLLLREDGGRRQSAHGKGQGQTACKLLPWHVSTSIDQCEKVETCAMAFAIRETARIHRREAAVDVTWELRHWPRIVSHHEALSMTKICGYASPQTRKDTHC